MKTTLKQRLVGLGLFFVAGVLFLPLVFDGAGYRERQLQLEVPSSPYNPTIIEIPAPEPLPTKIPPAASEKPVEQASAKNSPNPAAPQLDTGGLPLAWTLQLATFSSQNNADKLKSRLVAAGYKAYTRRKGEYVKVFVGPDIERETVEKLKARLKQDYKLDGLVIRFVPG